MAVVKINAIEVPDGAGGELEERFAKRLHSMDTQPGFLGFELLRPTAGERRYFVYTKWESEQHFQAWANRSAPTNQNARSNSVATGSSLLEFEVVLASNEETA